MKRFGACERAVHRYLWERFEAGQGSPTQREIAAATHYSRTAVSTSLRALEVYDLVDLLWLGEERLAARCVLRVRPLERKWPGRSG